MEAELAHLIATVETAVDETASEYAQMPFFVRPLVKRGFVRRTGRDFAAWRDLLAAARRGERAPELVDALATLAEHYRGAPERAKRGMGATAEQLVIIEQRSRARADAVLALHTALVAGTRA